ncbi:MAG TPA: twin-arginine translocase TatA/TatE family subunit [Rhizobiaceae bacterium]|nr:twin-arginine translocase TatA/TatE family subunit [Rhizobiaceae bacterium]
MDILGIGPMELLLILIVMLLVFGPDKLPQMGAKLGRTMRDMRKATRAISNEINATRDAITAEAKPITDPLQEVAGAAKAAGSMVAAAKNPVLALKESVLRELNTPVASAEVGTADAPENTIAPPEAPSTVITATPLEPVAQPEVEPAQTLLPVEPQPPEPNATVNAEDEASTPPSAAGADPVAGEQ